MSWNESVNDEKQKDLTSIFDLPLSEENAEAPDFTETPVSIEDDLAFKSEAAPFISEEFPSFEEEITLQPEPSNHSLEAVKQFSETLSIGEQKAAPTDPFTIQINGLLAPHEQTRLLDLIRIHDMGYRESDLEPQIEAGRILLSRISEYAAVLIVQALRGSSADIQVFPEADSELNQTRSPERPSIQTDNEEESHPAEAIPVTQDTRIPGFKTLRVIDVVTASYSFMTQSVRSDQNSEYDQTLLALTRELKYRAYRKKANALLHFRVQLLPLSLDSGHRLVVSATAAFIEPQSQ